MATRQYELLGLLAVAFLWQLLRTLDPAREPAARELYLLAATTAAGLLTHYHFALLLAAGATAAWWRLHRSPRRRRLTVLAALTAGLFLPLLVHPYVVTALRRSESRRFFEWAVIPERTANVLAGIAEFGGSGWVETIWVSTLVLAGMALWLPSRPAHDGRALGSSSSIASLLMITALVGAATLFSTSRC